MHEASIAQSLLERVEEALIGQGPVRVSMVRLKVGVLSGVVPEALQFAWKAMTDQTIAQGADLVIDLAPILARCGACEIDVEVQSPQRMVCPRCDRPVGPPLGGRELDLISLQVVDLPENGHES